MKVLRTLPICFRVEHLNDRKQPVMENVNQAMILAAGEGTRLHPLTLHRPKPMLPFAGRPVLEHTIAWLRYYGITGLLSNLHHCPQMVTDYWEWPTLRARAYLWQESG
jgi:UTP-glucose-1-phosphate uridylyltransferase